MNREIDYFTYADGTVYSTEHNIYIQETAKLAEGELLCGKVILCKSKQAVKKE